jgi:NCAIR mutase (PurE)-related protein
MNLPPFRELFEQVQSGRLTVEDAELRWRQYLREMPFEDLGFARVDHHRALRQGFPEVILGTGKTPAQVSAIAERIVLRGHTLLVTRTDEAAYGAVKAAVPAARFHRRATT